MDHELAIAEVFHVGQMDRRLKGRNSHEGAGLSVSLNPTGWTRIAQLGGHPTYALRRQEGCFLDFNSARQDTHFLAQVTGWAVERGYIAPCPTYRLWHHDGEEDLDCYMEFTSLEELLGEVGGDEGGSLARARSLARSQGQWVTRAKGWQVLPPALERARHDRAESLFGLDFAFLFYTEDETDLDGVWWRLDNELEDEMNDELDDDPDRGCIFESRLDGWDRELVDAPEPEEILA
jgi:hypothetical protein